MNKEVKDIAEILQLRAEDRLLTDIGTAREKITDILTAFDDPNAFNTSFFNQGTVIIHDGNGGTVESTPKKLLERVLTGIEEGCATRYVEIVTKEFVAKVDRVSEDLNEIRSMVLPVA